MGKALIIMVMGIGLYVSVAQVGTQETLIRTAGQQAGYEDEFIAREIARSGYNVAMAIARKHGSNLSDAIQEINGSTGFMTGEHQGGTYQVQAFLGDGFTIQISSTGRYRDAEHVQEDMYQMPVLYVQRCGRLQVRFLESMAGYCSAVFLQRYPYGVPPEQLPAPEMLFPAGHNNDNTTLEFEKIVAQGTQMDLFIGVDKNCSTRPAVPRDYDVLSHVFNPADYDHIHNALDIPFGNVMEMSESIWGFAEQLPSNRQRWRVGWEDQHILNWDNPDSENPANSLQATKRFGYDGNGWPVRDNWGYRDLRDYGPRPDFSDQVVEVWLNAINPLDSGGVCDIEASEPPPGGGEPDPPPDPDPNPSPDPDPDPAPDPDPDPDPAPGCMCPGDNGPSRTTAVMHRPPANESDEQIICVNSSSANRHLSRHNDYVVCEGN